LKKLSKERKAFFLFLGLSLLSALLITVDYHGKGILGLLKDTGFFIIKPVNLTVQNTLNHLTKYYQIFTDTEGIYEHNWKLEQENRELLYENAVLKEKLTAYERIAKMVQFKEYYNYEMIPAQVIGREPGNWFHSVIIDMGSKDGVEVDMGVATYKGLVGKIIQVERNTSEVLLIIDQGCSVGAMVQRPREVGVIKGSTESSFCYLDYVAHDADIQLNDVVVTSGMGSTIPKGIIIGRIVVIRKEKHELFQRILIKPEVDFNRLEEVFIVKIPENER
jgi:rod shape-determining protein MreC